MKKLSLFLFAAWLSCASTADASSCFGNFGDEEVIFAGEVLDVVSPSRDLIDKMGRAWAANTKVVEISLDRVLKGDVGHPGDVVPVAFTSVWYGEVILSVSAERGPILIGANRQRGGVLSWSFCNIRVTGSRVGKINWEGAAYGESDNDRFVKLWQASKNYESLIAAIPPAAASPAVVAQAERLLARIDDRERLVSFHRKRYLVSRKVEAGIDLVRALLYNRQVDEASELASEIERQNGDTIALKAVKQEIANAVAGLNNR